MGYTDMICFDFDAISGPAVLAYVQETDDGNVLLRLRDMVKNTVYTFNQSAAMNGLSVTSRVETITPFWITALDAATIILGLMTFACVATYLMNEFGILRKNKRQEVDA